MSTTIRNLLVKAGVDLTGMQKGFKQASKEMKAAGKEITSVGKSLTMGLTVPLLAIGGIAVKSAIDFESAFAGVRKTVNATEEELQGIKQGIIDMSKEIPSSTEEISKVAEAAGQLGIKSKDILGFSRVMIDLGNATNLSADQAATELARLANITGMLPENYERLGSTIVALGNNMATTEAEISAMSLRLAGAGKQVGMTEPQILGLAAALSSVGIEAEAGGSAMSKVMVNMQLAVAKGGKELKAFADVAGMSAGDFQKAFRRDASAALTAFIKGLGTMRSQGKDAIVVLDAMGITEVRMRDALLRAASAGDLFNDAIKLGVDAWEDNTALTKEAAERYGTLESQLMMLKNQVMDVARQLGEILVPILKDAIIPAVEWFADAIAGLVKWYSELSPQMQQFVGLLAGIVIAMGPVMTITGKIVTALGDVTKGLGAAVNAIKGGKGLIGALGAFLGPAGIAVAAIAGIALAAGGIVIAFMDANSETIKLAGEIKELKKSVSDTKKSFEDENKKIETNTTLARKLSNELYALNDKEKKTNTEKARMATLVKQLNEMYPDLNLLIDQETGLLNTNAQAVSSVITEKEKLWKFEAQERLIKDLIEEQTVAEKALEAAIIQLTGSKEKQSQADIDEAIALERVKGGLSANVIIYEDAKAALEGINVALGTEREGYEALAEPMAKQAQASADLAAKKEAEKAAVESVIAAQAEYDDAINTALNEYNAKKDEFLKAVKDTTDKYLNQMGGIFDKFDVKTDTSAKKLGKLKDELITNLNDQVKGFTTWSDSISKLSKKGVDDGLINELRQMGVKALPEVQALNTMTDTELNNYVETWRTKQKLAKDEALKELAPMTDEVVEKLGLVISAVNEQQQYFIQAGKDLGAGLAGGITESTPVISSAAREAAKKAITAAKSELGISSPSKVFKEIGGFMMKGLAIGIEKNQKQVNKILDEVLKKNKERFSKIKDQVEDVKEVHKKNLKEIAKAYKDTVEKIKESIASRAEQLGGFGGLFDLGKINNNVDAIVKAYESAVGQISAAIESRSKQIGGFGGLFDLGKATESETAEKMLENMRQNAEAVKDFENALQQLSQKDLPKELLDQLQELNVDSVRQLQTLNGMTGDQLAEYVELWQQKQASALNAAKKQYEDELEAAKAEREAALAEEAKAAEQMIENMRQNAEAVKAYELTLRQLAAKNLPDELLGQLQELGVESLDQLQTLNNMTGEQLAEYIGLWNEKQAAALAAAKKQYSDDLAAAKDEHDKALAAENQRYLNETSKLIASVENQMKKVGTQLVDGLVKGINASKSKAAKEAQALIDGIIKNIKKALGIKSPSTVFRDQIGAMMGEGVGIGFTKGMNASIADMRKSVGNMVSRLSEDLSVSALSPYRLPGAMSESAKTNNAQIVYNFGGNTYHSPKALSLREMRLLDIQAEQRRRLLGGL